MLDCICKELTDQRLMIRMNEGKMQRKEKKEEDFFR